MSVTTFLNRPKLYVIGLLRSPLIRSARWLPIPFLLLSVVLLHFGYGRSFEPYNPTLFTVSITMALFAINFSFLEYQFSPYKALQQAIPFPQMAWSAVILLVSLSPLLALVVLPGLAPTVCITTIPLVAMGGLLLSVSIRLLATPGALIDQRASRSILSKFLSKYAEDVEGYLRDLALMRLHNIRSAPQHEWQEATYPSPNQDDPFLFLVSLGLSATRNDDNRTLALTIDRLLDGLSMAYQRKHPEVEGDQLRAHHVDASIRRFLDHAVLRLVVASYKSDVSAASSWIMMNRMAAYVRRHAPEGHQIDENVTSVMGYMSLMARKLLDKEIKELPLVPIIVAREMAESGLTRYPKDRELYHDHLTFYCRIIRNIAERGFEVDDTEIVLRSVDALRWLGCETVKNANYTMAVACLQGLVAIGFRAKKADLKCFDPHCGRTLSDHAVEGVEWMASWLGRVDVGKREHWCRSFGRAYSYLRGFECRLEMEEVGGEAHMKMIETKKPYPEPDGLPHL